MHTVLAGLTYSTHTHTCMHAREHKRVDMPNYVIIQCVCVQFVLANGWLQLLKHLAAVAIDSTH
jgi:hypothetical protein